MNLKRALTYAASNWKSTIQAVLTPVIAVCAGLAVAPNPWMTTTLAAKLLGIGAIGKVILGALQSDGINLPAGSTVKQSTTVTTPHA